MNPAESRKDANEKLDQFFADAVERYKSALKEDFASTDLIVTDNADLSDIHALFRALSFDCELANTQREVLVTIKALAENVIALDKCQPAEHCPIYADKGWGLVGYKPANSWDEIVFLNAELFDEFRAEPMFWHLVNGKRESCVFFEVDFFQQFYFSAKWIMDKLRAADDGFTEWMFDKCQLVLHFHGLVSDYEGAVGVVEWMVRQRLNSDELDGDTWEG